MADNLVSLKKMKSTFIALVLVFILFAIVNPSNREFFLRRRLYKNGFSFMQKLRGKQPIQNGKMNRKLDNCYH